MWEVLGNTVTVAFNVMAIICSGEFPVLQASVVYLNCLHVTLLQTGQELSSFFLL